MELHNKSNRRPKERDQEKGARYKGHELFIVNYNSEKQTPLFDYKSTFHKILKEA